MVEKSSISEKECVEVEAEQNEITTTSKRRDRRRCDRKENFVMKKEVAKNESRKVEQKEKKHTLEMENGEGDLSLGLLLEVIPFCMATNRLK